MLWIASLRSAQKNSVGAHSICARQSSVSLRADMESAPTFCLRLGRKLHILYYFLFFIYYLPASPFPFSLSLRSDSPH